MGPFYRQIVLKELRRIRDEGTRRSHVCICTNIELAIVDELGEDALIEFDACKALGPYFYRWPEFSGDKLFPVPRQGLTPKLAFIIIKDLWGGEYGAARMRLVKFLIEELGSEIDRELYENSINVEASNREPAR